MNAFSGNRFGLRKRGNVYSMKAFCRVGACLIVFSVVLVFIYQNSIARFISSDIDMGEESCISRNESVLYRKSSSPYKPSSYLLSKLSTYEKLHEHCGPHTDSYKRSIKQLKSGRIDDNSTDCRYVVWVAYCGLGNRMLSITSAFLYALLTNRVLLINQEHDMSNLFCEPFPNTSWILPHDFPFKSKFKKFKQKNHYSYGSMLKSNTINYSTELLPSYLFLYLSHEYDHHDKLFFCDQDQALLSKVPWLIMKSNVYFLPSLFLISSFEQELSKLFPDKETVFHHLGRYLFLPSDRVWRLITHYYDDYLAKAEKIIGIQVRIFEDKPSPFEYVMDQILSCTQKEKLLPEVDTEKPIGSSSPSKNQTDKAVLITSLSPGYYKKMTKMYGQHPTKTGEVVGVYQPSHAGKQRSYINSHNIQAWVEIYLLSLCDELVTSTRSTFGYVAQGLRGMRPLILYKIDDTKPDPPCGRGMSMEPCYHAPPIYDCKAKTTVDTATLVPHLREAPEEQRCTIERASKLGAKPYDGSGDPEAALLWLDRTEQKISRRPWRGDTQEELCGPIFSGNSLTDFSRGAIKMQESRNFQTGAEIDEDKEQKCKRFMAGLNSRFVHGRNVRGNVPSVTSSANTLWGAGRGRHEIRSPATPGGSRPTLPECSIYKRRHPGKCRVNTTACFHCGQEGHFIKECPQLVTTKGSEAGIDTAAPTPNTGGLRHTGRGFQTRGASIATGRGAEDRGTRSRGGTPVRQRRRGSCT
ncbi:hypothetical protein JRO89_XS14G0121900 [Xanthoceras sorbifolium]|uniref:CCHC-type domain-containing protein n=1 Tax=Xanthoceras sorbifolium TaxID=99658 RepID=A0ABQ8H532_9ROSI|nr:hypothetical protein JRO89_XS14G0121900 [Xanthoceras sorbifolium]